MYTPKIGDKVMLQTKRGDDIAGLVIAVHGKKHIASVWLGDDRYWGVSFSELRPAPPVVVPPPGIKNATRKVPLGRRLLDKVLHLIG